MACSLRPWGCMGIVVGHFSTVKGIWGDPNSRDTILGVPIIRIVVFWVPCRGSPILANYHIVEPSILAVFRPTLGCSNAESNHQSNAPIASKAGTGRDGNHLRRRGIRT